MAKPSRKTILARSDQAKGLMIPASSFSQRQKAWDAMLELFPKQMETARIVDDVTGVSTEINQDRLNRLLSKSGRAHVIDLDGKVIFLLVECEENVIRDPDFDEDGNLIYNPARKK